MAKGIYIGVGGSAKKVKQVYVGVGGVAKKVKRAFIGGSDGKAHLWLGDRILNEYSWEEISQISAKGEAANYFSVGDRKLITLNGTVGGYTLANYQTYATIIGINHNASVEGGNRIHFQIGNTELTGGTQICLVDSYYNTANASATLRMNETAVNAGGWKSSAMRTEVCAEFKSVLPSDLKSVLKTVTKYTDNGGNASYAATNVTATEEEIFLLAEFEVWGKTTYGHPSESAKQLQYAYYAPLANSDRIRYRSSNTNSTATWWLRSTYRDNKTGFLRVGVSGQPAIESANMSQGFAPVFCV